MVIKPLAPGLSTNMIVTTDRRVYHIALASTARTAMAAVSWTYPQDSLLAIERAADATRGAVETQTAIDPVRLEFGYTIRGDKPVWRPLRAFDDGRQVYIEFPAALGQGEAPPLFVTGDGNSTELVNYRVSGRFYVVDRLFDRAELRHRMKRQTVVRIVRVRPGAGR
jgi:type IV secretion system protein TrbG